MDNETDLLLLNKVQNEDTVFEGHLQTEGSSVAVTIEDTSNPDDIEVIILNSYLPLLCNHIFTRPIETRISNIIFRLCCIASTSLKMHYFEQTKIQD